jgi:hypothetical protein
MQVLKYRHMYVKVNLLNKLHTHTHAHIYDCFLLYFNLAGLEDYFRGDATKHATYIPLTGGRYSAKRFSKAQCPIVGRLVNALMHDARTQQWQEVDGSQDCEAYMLWRLSTFLLPKTPFKSLMILLLEIQ